MDDPHPKSWQLRQFNINCLSGGTIAGVITECSALGTAFVLIGEVFAGGQFVGSDSSVSCHPTKEANEASNGDATPVRTNFRRFMRFILLRRVNRPHVLRGGAHNADSLRSIPNTTLARKIREFRDRKSLFMVQSRCLDGFETNKRLSFESAYDNTVCSVPGNLFASRNREI